MTDPITTAQAREYAEKSCSLTDLGRANIIHLCDQLDAANAVILAVMREVPAGYTPAHTPENLPDRVRDLVIRYAQTDRLEAERDDANAEVARVTKEHAAAHKARARALSDIREAACMVGMSPLDCVKLLKADRDATREQLDAANAEIIAMREEMAAQVNDLVSRSADAISQARDAANAELALAREELARYRRHAEADLALLQAHAEASRQMAPPAIGEYIQGLKAHLAALREQVRQVSGLLELARAGLIEGHANVAPYDGPARRTLRAVAQAIAVITPPAPDQRPATEPKS